MSFIRSFIAELNTQIGDTLCEKETVFCGLTQRGLLKDGKRFPVHITGHEGQPIIFDDRSPLQIYHRHRQTTFNDTDLGRGSFVTYEFVSDFELYGIGVRERISPKCFDGHEDIAFAVWSAIPSGGIWEATNASFIRLRGQSIITDSRQIIASEFTGLDEGKLNALTVIAFRIDYTLQGRYCGEFCDIGDITYTAP